jgi:hypothetical protein
MISKSFTPAAIWGASGDALIKLDRGGAAGPGVLQLTCLLVYLFFLYSSVLCVRTLVQFRERGECVVLADGCRGAPFLNLNNFQI